MATVKLENVSKKFYAESSFLSGSDDSDIAFAMENVNLTIPAGKVTAVIGPSGSGKTTLLKLIAGTERVDSGRILFDGEDTTHLSPEEKDLGMVFEDYALYPHFDVEDNILSRLLFSEKTRKNIDDLEKAREEKLARISESLEFEMKYLRERMPDTLSAGEKQRVALGRCIAFNPSLFLLDEPFSGFDPKLREKFRLRLHNLLQDYEITTLCVMHDQKEARLLAERIVLLNEGEVVQSGEYREIYEQPQNIFAAEFLSYHQEMKGLNLVPGHLVSRRFGGREIGFRPENAALKSEKGENIITAEVLFTRRLPGREELHLEAEVEDRELSLLVDFEEGELLTGSEIYIKPKKIIIFDQDSEEMLSVEEN